MSNTASMCTTVNPAHCPYHGLEIGMETAIAREDYAVYEQLRARKEKYEEQMQDSFRSYPTEGQLTAYGEAVSINHLNALGLQVEAHVELSINYISLWEDAITIYDRPPTIQEIQIYSQVVREASEKRLVLETSRTHINDFHLMESKSKSIIAGTIQGYAVQAVLSEPNHAPDEGILKGKVTKLYVAPSMKPQQPCIHYHGKWLIEPQNSYVTALFVRVHEYLEIFV